MDRATAEKVSSLMLQIGAQLNESVRDVQQSATEDEFKRYRSAVARIMGEILLEVLNPLYERHPELKPKELD